MSLDMSKIGLLFHLIISILRTIGLLNWDIGSTLKTMTQETYRLQYSFFFVESLSVKFQMEEDEPILINLLRSLKDWCLS